MRGFGRAGPLLALVAFVAAAVPQSVQARDPGGISIEAVVAAVPSAPIAIDASNGVTLNVTYEALRSVENAELTTTVFADGVSASPAMPRRSHRPSTHVVVDSSTRSTDNGIANRSASTREDRCLLAFSDPGSRSTAHGVLGAG
jgi:hypothetical protein